MVSTPANCTVVGVPGRVVKRDFVRIPRMEMNQVNLPDPVLKDISDLREENNELRAQIKELSDYIKGPNKAVRYRRRR